MQNKIKTLIVRFGNMLSQEEIPYFRGAIIQAVGKEESILFHNHDGEKVRYAYPLIQYKRLGGKAAIVCVCDGTEEVGKFFSACNFDVQIGKRPVQLEVESVKAEKTLVQVRDDMFAYRLRKWLPLNQEHYAVFQKMESIVEKYSFLESVLTGNILAFGKGVGVTFDKQIVSKITEVFDQRLITYKGVKMMSFDVEFKSNVTLPNHVGLGKGVSLGFGMVSERRLRND